MPEAFFSDTPIRSSISASQTELDWLSKKWRTFIAPGDRVLFVAKQKMGKSALATQIVKSILQKEADWVVLWAFNDGPRSDCNGQVASIFQDRAMIEGHIFHMTCNPMNLNEIYAEYKSIREKHPDGKYIVVVDTMTNVVKPGTERRDPALTSFLNEIAENNDILLGTAHLQQGKKAKDGAIIGVRTLRNETNVHISLDAKDVNMPIRTLGITGRGVPSIEIDNLAIGEQGIHPAKMDAAGLLIGAKKIIKTYRDVRPLISLGKDIAKLAKFLSK